MCSPKKHVASVYTNSVVYEYYNDFITRQGSCEFGVTCITDKLYLRKYNITFYTTDGQYGMHVVPCPAGLTCPIYGSVSGPSIGYVSRSEYLGYCGKTPAKCAEYVRGYFTVTEIVIS